MAKKGSITRTEQTREYLRRHPDQTNPQVLAGLKEQGVQVSNSLVQVVKKELGLTQAGGGKKRTKKVGKKKTSAKKKASGATAASTKAGASAAGRDITAVDLYEAKRLADELGGIDRVREALAALERLQ